MGTAEMRDTCWGLIFLRLGRQRHTGRQLLPDKALLHSSSPGCWPQSSLSRGVHSHLVDHVGTGRAGTALRRVGRTGGEASWAWNLLQACEIEILRLHQWQIINLQGFTVTSLSLPPKGTQLRHLRLSSSPTL